jgi:hypothetical protein
MEFVRGERGGRGGKGADRDRAVFCISNGESDSVFIPEVIPAVGVAAATRVSEVPSWFLARARSRVKKTHNFCSGQEDTQWRLVAAGAFADRAPAPRMEVACRARVRAVPTTYPESGIASLGVEKKPSALELATYYPCASGSGAQEKHHES